METTDSAVVSIVSTFTHSLDVFKALRERRKGRRKCTKPSRSKRSHEDRSDDESRLSKSLRQGPMDIQREYERNYIANGDRYAVGDSIAHASLAKTLRKLHTGLLSIISSLHSCGRGETQLDYKHLTSISDVSRQEALEALSSLSYRMSRSGLSLHPLNLHEDRGRKHSSSKDHEKRTHSNREKGDLKAKSKHGRDRDEKRPVVRRLQLSNSSEAQLVVVRPRTRRIASDSSRSEVSGQARSEVTPPPMYSTNPPSPIDFGFAQADPFPSSDHEVHSTIRSPSPLPQPVHHFNGRSTPLPPPQPSHYYNDQAVPRRRADKITPSTYTFASGSTKLGEIPMHKWNIPYDYEATAKMNKETVTRPWTSEVQQEQKPRRGLFKLFKKSAPIQTNF